MRWILAGLLLIASSSAAANHGGGKCGDRNKILQHLEEKYSEVVKHMAVTGKGALVEWTVASDGSWSMLVSIPNGPTCVMAEGQGWQDKTKVEGTKA